MKKLGLNVVLVLLAASALTSCNSEKPRALIDQRTAETKSGLQDAHAPAPPKTYNPLVVTDRIWAGSGSMRMRHGLPLPTRFETARGVTVVASENMPLSEIASIISNQTGLPVRIATDASPASSGGRPGPASATLSSAASNASNSGMPVSYEGSLSGLLDQVSGYFGVNWRFDGSSINFSRFETRIFMIEALPGTQTSKDAMKEATQQSSSNGSGSSGASSNNDISQTSEMAIELKVWDELGQTVNAILGGVGSAVVSPSSGAITVTTTPETMRSVARYIEQENRRLSKQIAINVEVYSINLSDGTDFNVAFNTALKKLATFGANVTSASGPTTITGGGSLNMAILNPDKTGQITDVLTALSSVGDATRVAQFPLTTLNNRTVSRRIGHDRAYVASATNTTSTSTSGTSSSTITPGMIQEGFSLQVTPRLLDDGRVMLQYSFSLVDIVKIRDFTSGAGDSAVSVQLPETANRVFIQQSLLKSGSTLVIGGYDDEQVSQASTGFGNAFNYLLGGGVSNLTSHAMLFIAITPQVIDLPHTEQE